MIHNQQIRDLVRSQYQLTEIQELRKFLKQQGTLRFKPLENGLFPAAAVNAETAYTGYANVWVRDNIHVAHAHWVLGEAEVAAKTLSTLMEYFKTARPRFEAVIETPTLADDPMNRPHIRFDGATLAEIDQKWSHAQNDALGYFLWLYCRLVLADVIEPTAENLAQLALFPAYFQAVRFWEDADSGHWEEARKVEASSIGPVVAGLRALTQVLHQSDFAKGLGESSVDDSTLEDLIQQGERALGEILPAESLQPPEQQRRYDSALLFLVYPLDVVDAEMRDQIVSDVIGNLQGDYGIKRYLNDSFWAPDYRTKTDESERTHDVSDDSASRDALLSPGGEAQWCIFDPIISVIYGLKYQSSGDAEDLRLQTHYLNRSVGQITSTDCSHGGLLCPELYCLEDGQYVPNDATPLLWTQANLSIALHCMEQSLSPAEG